MPWFSSRSPAFVTPPFRRSSSVTSMRYTPSGNEPGSPSSESAAGAGSEEHASTADADIDTSVLSSRIRSISDFVAASRSSSAYTGVAASSSAARSSSEARTTVPPDSQYVAAAAASDGSSAIAQSRVRSAACRRTSCWSSDRSSNASRLMTMEFTFGKKVTLPVTVVAELSSGVAEVVGRRAERLEESRRNVRGRCADERPVVVLGREQRLGVCERVPKSLGHERQADEVDLLEPRQQVPRQVAARNPAQEIVAGDEERRAQCAEGLHALGVEGARRDHPEVELAAHHQPRDLLIPVGLARPCRLPDGL